MKIKLILTGKTAEKYVKEGFDLYEKRLLHYISFDKVELPDLKGSGGLSQEIIKEKEGEQQLKQVLKEDYVVLLDEKGVELRSVELAGFLQKRMNSGIKSLVFIIGGPYGFSSYLHKRANAKLSLSKLTFSHQIVRLLFMEQIYRAFTIIKNEPYHNEG
jgi:23S rRNA (pseudouridine1915-N3)-methyltransferase